MSKVIRVEIKRAEGRADEELAEIFSVGPKHPVLEAVHECIDDAVVAAYNAAAHEDNTAKWTDMGLGGAQHLLKLKQRLNELVEFSKQLEGDSAREDPSGRASKGAK